ncbi:MAG: amidohydrolase [Anaerolineae bacterium]|nr:amidohydrolase [Anaerolineae bacterium]
MNSPVGNPAQVDLLIRHGAVITMDRERTILYDGAVAVDQGRIVALGPTDQIVQRYLGRETVDARHKAVLPGLVDTHHHFLQNLLKGMPDDLELVEWVGKVSSPRIVLAVQGYLAGDTSLQIHSSRLGCVEALRSGITCLLNMEWATPPEVVEVFEGMGIRIVHALTLTDVDQWNREGMLLPGQVAMDLADALIERCRRSEGGRVSFRYGLACPNSCSGELIRRVRALATEKGVGIHIHIAETRFEWGNIHHLYGKTPTRYLYDLGLLGPDVLGAHCIWLSDSDIALLRETGTAVAHNPECNMKVADGIAPVARMLQAGVTVSLGTDSCAVNDNMDMFEAMRVAAFLQKVSRMDATALSAYEVLEMATIGGAKALGLSDEIGSLEPGKKADLIVVDLTGPHMRPINNLVNNLVYCASAAADVDTVVVDGRVLVRDRRLLVADEQAVIAAAEECVLRRSVEGGLPTSPYYQRSS